MSKQSDDEEEMEKAIGILIELDLMRDALQWLCAAAALRTDPLPLLRAHQPSAATFQKGLKKKDVPLRMIENAGRIYERRLANFRVGVEARVKLAMDERMKR